MRRFASARVVVGVGSQLFFRGLFDVGVKVIHTFFVDILLDYLVLHRVGRCVRHDVVDDGLGSAVLNAVQLDLILGGHQAISVRRGNVLPGLFVQFCGDNLVLHRVGRCIRHGVVDDGLGSTVFDAVQFDLIRGGHQAISVRRCGCRAVFGRARFDAVQLGFVGRRHQAVDVLCGNTFARLFAQRGGHDLVLHGMRGL